MRTAWLADRLTVVARPPSTRRTRPEEAGDDRMPGELEADRVVRCSGVAVDCVAVVGPVPDHAENRPGRGRGYVDEVR